MLTSRSNGARVVTSTPVEQHLAGSGQLEAGDHPQDGRLTRARGAEQRQELAVRDVEVDAVNGTHVPEGLDQAAEAHGRGHGR